MYFFLGVQGVPQDDMRIRIVVIQPQSVAQLRLGGFILVLQK